MRKIVSIILSASILLSALLIFPAVVSAENAPIPAGTIVNNYDESFVSYQTNGTFTTNTYNGATTTRTVNGVAEADTLTLKSTVIEQTTGVDGQPTYAARFGPALNGTAYTTNYWSADKLNVLKLYNSGEADLGLFVPNPNTIYTLTLNYRSDVAPDSGKPLRLMLMQAKSSSDFTYAAANVLAANVVDIPGTTDGWKTATATFQTGDAVTPLYIAMISVNTWYSSNADVWVDNVSITKKPTVSAEIVNNFDGTQYTYYTNNRLDTSDERFAITNLGTESAPDYAAKFTRISSGTGDSNGWMSNYANAFGVYDTVNNGVALFEKDKGYSVSVDVRRAANTAGFRIGLLFGAADTVKPGSFGNIKICDYRNAGKVVPIHTFETAGIDSDFITYTASIEAPLTGVAAVVMYNDTNSRVDGQVVYIDNLKISAVVEKSALNVTTNDYDESFVSYQTNGTFANNDISGATTTRTVNGVAEANTLTLNSAVIDQTTGADGQPTYAARFGPARNGTCYTSNYWSAEKLNVLKIYNSYDNGLVLFVPEANTKYSLTLNYRSDVTPDASKPLRLMLMQAQSESNFVYAAANVLADNLVTIPGTTDGWQTVSVTFRTGDTTAPLYIAMISASEWWSSNADVWVDNISIDTFATVESEIVNDFEGSQKNYFETYELDPAEERFAIDNVGTADEPNYAAKYMRISAAGGNFGGWQSNYANAFSVYDNMEGNPALFSQGQIYQVTVDVKRVTNTAAFHIGMLFGSETEMIPGKFANLKLDEQKSAGKIKEIHNFSAAGTDNDFVTYTAYVQAPLSGYAAIIMYNDTDRRNDSQVIYVDNLKISAYTVSDETELTFTEAQQNFMNNHKVSYVAETATMDDGHEGAMKLTRILALKDINYRANEWAAAHPAAFPICDPNAATCLKYHKGDVLTVSYQIKKPADIPNTYFDEFTAALIFNDADKGIMGWLSDMQAQDRIAPIGTIGVEQSDWVTYTATVTVPHDGYAMFAIYGKDWFMETNVYVDNVKVSRFDAKTLNRNGDVNEDGTVNILDLVRIKKMAAQVADCTVYADIDFDGVIAGASDVNSIRKALFGFAITLAPASAKGRTLVWNEEFNGNALSDNVQFLKTMNTASETLPYTVTYDNAANHKVEDGKLTLSVTKTDDGYSLCEGVTTYNSMNFKYGYLEMSAKVPTSVGAWPSLWLLGSVKNAWRNTDLEWFSEIDVFECFGNNYAVANVFRHGVSGTSVGHSESLDAFSRALRQIAVNDNEFHRYGLEWVCDEFKFYYDDTCFYTLKFVDFPQGDKIAAGTEGFNEPVYVSINNEIRTQELNGTDPIAQDYVIDYIRLYQNTVTDQLIVNSSF